VTVQGKVLNPALGYARTDGAPDTRALDWDYFRVFAIAAREGSYTRAARKLSITQSAVSRRIARLEKAIGVRLFDRGTRGVSLTSEGAKLLNYANGAELMLARGVGSVRAAASRVEGDCKVVAGDGLGTYWLPRFFSSFLERNPNIGLKFFTTQDHAASQTPLFDLQIHYAHPLAEDSVAIFLGTLHFVLFASPEYLMNFGMPVTCKDLRHHRVLDLTLRLTERGSLAHWAGLDYDGVIMTNSSAVLGETVRSGGGIALLPTYAALVDTKLVPVMTDMHFHAPLFVCFEREAGMKPAVRATLEYLKEFVFDRHRMPWFFDHFVAPQKEWSAILQNCLDRASTPDRRGHAIMGS
jgi:DNA-binding transcriptional LysR family regulator